MVFFLVFGVKKRLMRAFINSHTYSVTKCIDTGDAPTMPPTNGKTTLGEADAPT